MINNVNKPRISVIMSVHNNEDFLKESLDSLLNQSFNDFEVLLTDDCSTDNSYQIMCDYEKHDKRFRIFQNSTNIGLTKTLNNMISLTHGEYIARLDGDDLSYPDRFLRQVEILDRSPSAIMVHSGNNLIDEGSNFICRAWKPRNQKKIQKNLEERNYIVHSSIMIRRDVLLQNHYDETYIKGQDWELWKRLHRKGYDFAYIKQPLIEFRLNTNSVRKIWNPGDDPAYFFANICISNFRKLSSLKYWKDITKENRIKFIVKFLIPRRLFLFIKTARKMLG